MRTPLVSLLLLASLGAGCASPSHEEGAHGGEVGLLFGVVNEQADTLAVAWTVTALDNGTIVWTRAESIGPGKTVERIEPLETRGEHRIDLSWGDGRTEALSFDTRACEGSTHLIVVVQPDGALAEHTRECHA